MIAAPTQARVLSPFSSRRSELESSYVSGTLEPINPRLRELKRPTMVDRNAMKTKSPLRLTNLAQTYDPNSPVILAVCTTFMINFPNFIQHTYQAPAIPTRNHSSDQDREIHFACLSSNPRHIKRKRFLPLRRLSIPAHQEMPAIFHPTLQPAQCNTERILRRQS